MYFFLIIAAFGCLAHADEWSDYKAKHGKVYATEEDDAAHWLIWAKNVEDIEKHNSENGAFYEQGVNEFTDMTDEEYDARMGFRATEEEIEELRASSEEYVPSNDEVPDEIDWRTEGLVTPVKNQGHCGSCYSFSATGALEGQWFKKTGKLISLSESQIVDCSRKNHGCSGGLMNYAWDYLAQAGGDETEEAYPYVAVKNSCHFQAQYVAAKVKGSLFVRPNNEDILKQVVGSFGPVSIAIFAGRNGFRHYKKGVYSDTICRYYRPNHAVLIAGYGVDNGTPYWLVKNSWGEGYGEGGYIKMVRGKNICNIASTPMVPKMDD